MISNYKVKVNDSCNYKVSITDIQNKYKFKLFCAGADLTDYYTKEQVDQSQNTQDILIDNILNQIPTGTATGETINITDSSSLPLKDIQVAGNTYQETTTGKNLFDKDNANTINAYVNSTTNKLVSAGEGTGCFYIPCEANTTYTVSKTELFGNDRFCVFDTARVPTAGDTILSFVGKKSGVDTNTSYTITTTATATYLGVFVKANVTNPAKTMQEIAETIQIEKNPSATSYEKYTGGNPAPNPDYPQTISNVTGTNTIKIVGKNLFDGILEIGNFNSNTGEKIANNDYIINTNPIPVEELTNYKISSNGTGIRMYVFEYKEDMTYNLSVRKTVNADSYLTTNSGTKYINFRTVDANTNLQEKIQVEKGTTATTYEAYKEKSYTINLGSIELCKIGDYKDRIYYSSGKWYLEQKIGKVVLNGSENWYKLNLTFRIDTDLFSDILSAELDNMAISNYFIYWKNTGGISTQLPNNNFGLTATKLIFNVRYDNIADVNTFKTWLSTHNAEVYYVLATPTTTEITDTTLIGQLDALLNSTTYKTTTNITVDTTNQKPTLTLTYRKDLETLIGG